MSLLELETNDDAHKMFMKLTNMEKRIIKTILNMDRSGIKDLKHTDAEGNTLALDPWEISEVINISRYATYIQAEKGENFHLKDIDKAPFEKFQLNPTYSQVQHTDKDITRTPLSSFSSINLPSSQQQRNYTQHETFRKGIKRDSTIFSTFKYVKHQDNLRIYIKATAMAQDVDEVLYVNYNLTSVKYKDLFQEEQKFMNSVFERNLRTDQGNALVRQ